MGKKLLADYFRELDRSIKLKIAKEKPVLRQCLAILGVINDHPELDQLTIDEIKVCANACGFKLNRNSIMTALSRGDKYVLRSDDGKNYQLSIHGEEVVNGLIEIDGPLVFYVKAGTPYSTRRDLEGILNEVNGDIVVVDPYFGEESFKILELLTGNKNVRMITSRVNNRDKVVKVYRDFKKEYPNVEVRVYPASKKELHDRYILSDDYLILTGHGIKDIGNSESFVIMLDSKIAGDIMKSLKGMFEERWIKSAELS